MGMVFLCKSSTKKKKLTFNPSIERALPFIYEGKANYRSDHLLIKTWWIESHNARGSFVAQHEHHFLAYHGWIVEPTVEIQKSVAESLLEYALTHSIQDLQSDHMQGEFNLLYMDGHTLHCFSDPCNTQKIYYASINDEVWISNRASLIAYEIGKGRMIKPSLKKLSCLLTKNEMTHDAQSAWSDIHALPPYKSLQIHTGKLILKDQILSRSMMSIDQLSTRFFQRCEYLKSLPQARFKIALTAGLDSRAILAICLKTHFINQIDHSYLRIAQGHVDDILAQQLCQRYGLRYQRVSPLNQETRSLLELIRQHNFYTEYFLNAWDLKFPSITPMSSMSALHGNYGEFYREHGILKGINQSWFLCKHIMLHSKFINYHGVLQPDFIQYYRTVLKQYFAELEDHVKPDLRLQRIHNDFRMRGWVPQTSMFDSLATLNVNLLLDAELIKYNESLTRSERNRSPVHYELIRRAMPELLLIPHDSHQWHPKIDRSVTFPSPLKNTVNTTHRNFILWKEHAEEMSEFLLSTDSTSEFFDYVNRDALSTLVQSNKKQAKSKNLKAIFTACAMKQAVEEDLLTYQFQM